MTRQQMKNAADNEIIMEYVSYGEMFVLAINTSGRIKAVSKHLEALDAEMLRRGLLTQQQIGKLNR